MNRERKILLNVVILVIALCMAGVACADDMGTAFTYQGRLADANSPAEGLYDFQFKLYDSTGQVGGDINQSDVDVIDGYFTVELDFGADAFIGVKSWLEIGIRHGELEDPNDYTPLSPRQELTPTPHAIYAENAGSDNDWAVSGDDMYSTPSGNVGIGTTTPAHKLEVKAPTNQALSLSTESTNSHVDIQGTPTGSGSMRFNVFGGANAITFNVNNTEKVRMNSNGDVGIGTASPGARLEVNGQVKITGGSPGADKVLTSDAGGLATWQILSVGSVPWTNLTGIPADFADNIDNVGLTVESDPTVAASVKDGVSWGEVSGIPAGFADGVDDVATSMPWTNLTGIPADFADNIDNVGLTAESDPTVAASVKDGVSWGEVSGIPAGFSDGVDDVATSMPWTSITGIPADFADNIDNVGLTVESDPTVLASVKDGVSWVEVSDIPAGFADGVDDGGDSDWQVSGSDMYSIPSGNVGIGTTTPAAKLDVSGDISASSVYKIGGNTVLSVAGGNTLVGIAAGAVNTGNANTFSGYQAGYSNTTGYGNTFSGNQAGYNNTEGYANTFSGYWTGFNNTTGHGNTFSGLQAGYLNTTGSDNTFSGYQAGSSNTTGGANTFSGNQAGYSNTTGHHNTFSGDRAGFLNTTGIYNTFSGYQAGRSNTIGNCNIFSGYQAGYSNTTGHDNTFSGYLTGYSNTEGHDNTFSGDQAGYSNTTGNYNTFSGYWTGYNNTTGHGNTFSGSQAGRSNTTGGYNTFSGYQAGRSNTTGGANIFLGYEAGSSNTTGVANTFSGSQAGHANTEGNYNTFSGDQAGYNNTTGHYNTFSGSQAGFLNQTGVSNTFSGTQAGWLNSTGSANTFSGYQAGSSNTTGYYNTFSGHQAGFSNTTGVGNVFIGNKAGYYETGNDKLYIANSSSSAGVLIYGDFSTGRVGISLTGPTEALDVDGTARLRGIGSSTGTTVVADTNGKLWKLSSSQRYKTNIETLDTGADAVFKLRPVSFEYKESGQKDIGLIAEEVEKISPDLVIYDNEGRPDAVKYDKVALYLLSVVKNQQEQIATLKEKISQNQSLEQRVDAMESLVTKLSLKQEGGVK